MLRTGGTEQPQAWQTFGRISYCIAKSFDDNCNVRTNELRFAHKRNGRKFIPHGHDPVVYEDLLQAALSDNFYGCWWIEATLRLSIFAE